MRFRDVRHQDRALSLIRRALRSGRWPHAYLFEGPEGVGKELTARALAARLLCHDDTLAPDADACGQCAACRLLACGNHPDFHLIYRGLHKFHPDRGIRMSKGLFVGVDLIRHFLIEPAANAPALGRRRVFLIREAERMNEEAQNALLKTLEEPPGEACLIVVTTSAERLLPTVRSRCQRVPFGLLPPAFVEAELITRLGLTRDDAQTLARLSDGRLGAALRWQRVGLLDALEPTEACLDRLAADDLESFGREVVEIAVGLAGRAAAGDSATDAATVDAEPGEDADETPRANARTVPTDELREALGLVLMVMAAHYRDALVEQAASAAPRHLPRQHRRTAALARAAPPGVLDDCLRAVARAEWMLAQNVAPQLVMERLGAALTGVAASA